MKGQTKTQIRLRNQHNHDIGRNEITVRFRDVGEATRQTLRLLYKDGHVPQTAYHILKTDYFMEYGNE